MDRELFRNGSGYADPTAREALHATEREEKLMEYLSLIGKAESARKALAEQIHELRMAKMFPGVQGDGMPHGSGYSDLSTYAAKIEDLKDQRYDLILEIIRAKKVICRQAYLAGDKWGLISKRYIEHSPRWKTLEDLGWSKRMYYDTSAEIVGKIRIRRDDIERLRRKLDGVRTCNH